jgi:hypothetical protein
MQAQLMDIEQSEQACIAKYNTARERLAEANEEAARWQNPPPTTNQLFVGNVRHTRDCTV